MFAPIIALLSWIPLIGSLLGFAMKVAAFITALVFGGTVASLVLGLAWLWFRPLYGVGLLLLTAGGLCCIFLIEGDTSSS